MCDELFLCNTYHFIDSTNKIHYIINLYMHRLLIYKKQILYQIPS